MKTLSEKYKKIKNHLTLSAIDFVVLSLSFFLVCHWFQIDKGKIWFYYFVVLAVKILFFTRLGLYHAILRFAGMPLASTILKATALASLLCFLLSLMITWNLPNGFWVMDYLMTTFLIGLVRFAPRYLNEFWRGVGTKRILIYGAGGLGEEVARKLLRNPGEYYLVGFIDDALSKIGKRVHNLPIYGPVSRLAELLSKHNISELIIAISSLNGEAVRDITLECRKKNVFCRIVPPFRDMLKKEVDIKNLDISDLLKREPRDLDEAQIRRFIRGKVVAITGAGGSIGSELTRQCLRYGASRLVLIDHSEFNLYALQEEMVDQKKRIRFCLLNILNQKSFEDLLSEERPEVLFHAAAYKHLPIVEDSPFEGLMNNVSGTMVSAQVAEKCRVEKYVLISTDKAVRPTSIMGASKRIAELYIQNLNPRSKTEFVAVRFGNVLGSSGSVIPKFIQQINEGGPVTVTHPEVTRYFMLVSEAVQLVLQAASIGTGGQVFILNMGKPIRIAEMAEDLIFISGREPHKDIQIEFTGLRPGEKLYEELLIEDSEKKTQYENITIARASHLNWEQFTAQILDLLHYCNERNYEEMLKMTRRLVPEFIHANLPQEQPKSYPNVIKIAPKIAPFS